MGGGDRYDIKAQAGWTRTRADGSAYDRTTDERADAAESWFADTYNGVRDTAIHLHGDAGYDVVLWRRGCLVHCDVIHAGTTDDGPRRGIESCVIVNPDSNKLIASDLLVFVEGPPFAVVGCIYTNRFLAQATLRDHGHGLKFSLPASRLQNLEAILGRRW